jgi:Na+/melibiose symporter-like transporter
MVTEENGQEVAEDPDPPSLWRNRDFLRLWGGETLSQIGSQVTELALPLAAILLLGAGAGEVGLLATALTVPVLLSIFAGAWVNNFRGKQLMTVLHLSRAVLISSIPLAYLVGWLSIGLLAVVAFAVGLLTAMFNVVYLSYVPSIVDRRQLVDANARLEATYTISQIGGPGLGGMLVQLFAAPLALLVDGVTYLAAGLLSSRIEHEQPRPQRADRPPAWQSIKDGIAIILRHPVLRPLVLISVGFNLFGGAVYILFLLFGTRDLGLSPGVLGACLAVGSVGGLVGTLLARPLAAKFGMGQAMTWSMLACSVSLGLVPAAAGSTAVVVAVLIAGLVLNGVGLGIFNVHSLSARALLIPGDKLGVVTGSFQALSIGALPASGVLTAALGSAIGTRAAIAVCVAALTVLAVLFVLSKIRHYDGSAALKPS